MLRRTLLAGCVLALCASGQVAVADDRRPAPPIKRTIALTLTDAAMAAVPIGYRIRATPATGAPRLRVAVQVRSARGWVTLRSSAPDRRGNVSGSVVSNRAGVKQYRAILLSTRGRVLSATPPTTVTWTRLEHRVELACTAASAPVGVDVPCTIAVTPAVRLEDMIAVLQMRGRTEWIPLEAARVPASGRVSTHVTGLAPGTAEFRAQLMRDAVVRAESAMVSIEVTPLAGP